MKLSALLAAASLATLTSSPALLAAELGDPAAPLTIAEWVKGGPVNLADGKGKTIHVVEFWATWCPPCRTSIPHLTEMQKRFKDKGVVFIGITDEKASVVKPFVEKMGDKMDYVVAIDRDRKTSTGYMKAYGINGIPHAFIVDKDGKVAWQGHPMDGLDRAIEEILAGKYDLKKAKLRASAQQKLEAFMEIAADDSQKEKADQLAKELEVLDKEVGGLMDGQPFNADEIRKQAKFGDAMNSLAEAIFTGESAAKVDELTKKAEAVAPPGVNVADYRQMMLGQVAFQGYVRALAEGDEAKAAELAKELTDAKFKNPQLLNQFAWAILTDDNIKKRDIPLATQLAKAAVDASGAKDANILDTYARALFDGGKTEEAIAQQKKAISLADPGEMKEQMEKTLKEYEARPKAK
ncbi:MAG: redoxin domain-containing protein [Verrucomicrobia bacterium]|nr:redoxin domain-containing protein [Verrucomicrobiota bacterium]